MKLVPVIVDGEILLYDIYFDGVWWGSMRTIRQIEFAYGKIGV